MGKNIENNPEIFERIKTDGHSIGNHSYSHLNGLTTSRNRYLQDVEKCQKMSRAHHIVQAEEFDNIIGIKEASGNLEQCMEIIKNKPDNFSLTSGDDVLALPLTLLGGVGVISVIGQAYPLDLSNMIRNALNQDILNATKKHYQNFLSILSFSSLSL